IFLAEAAPQKPQETSPPSSTPAKQPTPPQTTAPAPSAHSEPPQVTAPRHTVIPDTFTNLKVLPKDIKKPELVQIMRGFASQLGRRCKFCHEVNDDLSEGNFASDKKIEKETARVMINMMAEINAEFLAKLPEEPAEATCWTCHRGKNKPEKYVPPDMPAGAPQKPPGSATAPP